MKELEKTLENLESKCRMVFHEPVCRKMIEENSEFIPEELCLLWEISDGLEVNAPGTVFYSMDQVKRLNKAASSNLLIGHMNFGDQLFLSKEGELIQKDHETDEVFLKWENICTFLEEELRDLGGNV